MQQTKNLNAVLRSSVMAMKQKISLKLDKKTSDKLFFRAIKEQWMQKKQ